MKLFNNWNIVRVVLTMFLFIVTLCLVFYTDQSQVENFKAALISGMGCAIYILMIFCISFFKKSTKRQKNTKIAEQLILFGRPQELLKPFYKK